MLPPLLHHSGFRRFFLGRAVSLLGSAMAPVALAFAVLDAADGRAADLGAVLAVRMVPLLGLMLLGGAVADRLPRRTVLLVTHLGAGLSQGAAAALLLTGHYALAPFAALEFANGALTAFTAPALRGVLPELVPADRLRPANALLGMAGNGSKVLGPVLAGLLVAGAGPGWAVALDAASYLPAAYLLAGLPTGPRRDPDRPTGLYGELREGWTVFRHTRWLWWTTWSCCATNLLLVGPWQILGPALAGPALWGVLLAARGAGLLLADAAAYRLAPRRLLAAGQLAGLLLPLPLLALGRHAPAALLFAAAAASGLGLALSATAWETSLQEHLPNGVLSRVSANADVLCYLAIPLGQLACGPLTARFGAPVLATAAALAQGSLALLPLLSPAVRRLPHPAPTPAPAPAAVI
ncbi:MULTISPECIES: MFS transporter [Kitasatospora]|uniref:Putative major facilitator superfamily transporter n=1 Tax=Kitasatospora setae (strain ATCC 33774 / DSM 43861 / JCM 3304 / KCC A-0304 / NBRC 14216 / KM-6054) TaxID=452652 RepID=E4N8A8_KITSK|nr:MFS transporter [Kitasatospora setae]BAJ27439.1 putative major facilitator superfamily transporter [Kitasatospora setae KM-6054]